VIIGRVSLDRLGLTDGSGDIGRTAGDPSAAEGEGFEPSIRLIDV
jgi:hypothetical protein